VTPERLRAALHAAGFDVVSCLPRALYDGLVSEPWRTARVEPGCRSIWLIGHSGHHFWSIFQRSPEARLASDPVDSYTRRSLLELMRALAAPAELVLYLDQRDGAYLPLLSLAKAAGLGAPSRLGLLLHPRLGPWWALRAALFLSLEADSVTPELTSPCVTCPAPCQTACHGSAISPVGIELDRCLATRASNPACFERCDSRLACVIGREHTFEPDQLRHHSRIAWTDGLRSRASAPDRALVRCTSK